MKATGKAITLLTDQGQTCILLRGSIDVSTYSLVLYSSKPKAFAIR